MISLEHRILDEYRIKIAKIETLARFVRTHNSPKGIEATQAQEFLKLLIDETDKFYENHGTTLSNNGKRPHARSLLAENIEWNTNVEKFYENNPRKRSKR